MQKVFSIFTLLLLFGCKDTVKQQHSLSVRDNVVQSLTKSDTLPKTKRLSENERELAREEMEEQERMDSIRLSNVLHIVLTYADCNKHRNSFQHEFEMTPDDSSFNVTAQMIYGNLFASNRKHLLVRRTVPWGAICNVFLLDNGNFKNVCEREQLGMTYIDDTLRDVNGDGYNDFLVHWYPSSGCCRRDVYNAFLYQPQTGAFTNDYEFINPTFSTKEKIIRGVEYGHPGEVGLYKYKWNGLKVDTIEFVYPFVNHKGKFVKTKKQEYRPTEKDGIVLSSLPIEYKRIKKIELFFNFLKFSQTTTGGFFFF